MTDLRKNANILAVGENNEKVFETYHHCYHTYRRRQKYSGGLNEENEDGESVQFVIIGNNKASIKPREKSDEGECVA